MKIVLVILLLSGLAFSQNATVVELSKEDAAKAQQLWEAKQKADKDWDTLSTSIRNKTRIGDIEFSKDFHFVVPAQMPTHGSGIVWNNPCVTLAPAITSNSLTSDGTFWTAR